MKKISYHWVTKTIAFLLACVTFGLSVTMSATLVIHTGGRNALFHGDYLSTRQAEDMISKAHKSIETLLTLKNDDYIINEYHLSNYEETISVDLKQLQAATDFLSSITGFFYFYSDGERIFTNCDMTTVEEFSRFALYNISEEGFSRSTVSFYVDSYIPVTKGVRAYIALEEYAMWKADIAYKNLVTLVTLKNEEHIRGTNLEQMGLKVQDSLREFASAQHYLNNTDGIYYYATNGENVFTNCDMTTAAEFRGFKRYNIIDGFERDFKIGTYPTESSTAETKVFIAFDDAYIANKQAEFAQEKKALQDSFSTVLVLFLVGLFSLIYLLAVCGKKSNGEFALLTIDRLWTDVTGWLMLITSGLYLYVLAVAGIARTIGDTIPELYVLCATISALFCGAGVTLLLSLVRHLKNKTLIRHSLTYFVCSSIGGIFKRIARTILDSTPLNVKIIGAITLTGISTMISTMIGAIIGGRAGFLYFVILTTSAIIAIIYVMIRFVIKPYDDEVKTRLERSLNREMKAERLKTELITNVSHDLKTPLTAIINYSDLLVQQDANNEYAAIIYEKSQKLKSLTEGLFEVSKAQSGNISINAENLNVLELINQTLAEFDEHTIEFKINVPNNASILADSKLMSRVFENLIGNIIKYSLGNTRAYIEAHETGKKTCITFKNIANYEMGFDSSEITERFSRGDTSRTTDGNGLGLAIAQSYTEACGGSLTIDADGDLFKATIVI